MRCAPTAECAYNFWVSNFLPENPPYGLACAGYARARDRSQPARSGSAPACRRLRTTDAGPIPVSPRQFALRITPTAAAHGAIGGLRHNALLIAHLLCVQRGARLLPRQQRRARSTRAMSTATSASLRLASVRRSCGASAGVPARSASCAPSMACFAIGKPTDCARVGSSASVSARAARRFLSVLDSRLFTSGLSDRQFTVFQFSGFF